MEMYNDYNFGGMHFIEGILWAILLFWIFLTPNNILGQRGKKDSLLDILKKRYTSGSITTEEFKEKKQIIDENTEN